MNTIALQEHFLIPELLEAWGELDEPWVDDPAIRMAQLPRWTNAMSEPARVG